VLSPTDEKIQAIADHYRTHHPRAKRSYVKGCKEYDLLVARLKEDFTVEDICDAIDGCHQTPHNLGLNDRKTAYLDLALIVRDSTNVNRFMRTGREGRPQVVDPTDIVAYFDAEIANDERMKLNGSR
jgi:hypothetical protein